MIYIIQNGKKVLIDKKDVEIVDCNNWYKYGDGYISTSIKPRILMHRLITGAKRGQVVDHLNGNKSDNRRANLRICSYSENSHNKTRRGKLKNKLRGVSWSKSSYLWRAGISKNGVKYCKFFKTKEQTIAYYNKMAIELYGQFAQLNKA